MPHPSYLIRASLILLVFTLSSCGIFQPKPAAKAKPVLFEWEDDHGPGELSMTIDLGHQIATYRRGGRTIGWSFVSTGREGHSTPPGDYKVTEMLELKNSNRYGWITDAEGKVTHGDAKWNTPVPAGQFYHPAPMPYWMRITHYGIGLHAGEIPVPGEAASHGCIRLPRDFVPKLYAVTKPGTSVKITRSNAPHFAVRKTAATPYP
jgi:lipoprotein-anchoring transpeptidase ErfK/SrfK